MKLRLKDNTLRLRLTKTETELLQQRLAVKGSTPFGPLPAQALTYAIVSNTQASQIDASFQNQSITISVPHQQVTEWANTNQVSMRASLQYAPQTSLEVLIEKDFQCLTERANGDDADTFPNPAAQKT